MARHFTPSINLQKERYTTLALISTIVYKDQVLVVIGKPLFIFGTPTPATGGVTLFL